MLYCRNDMQCLFCQKINLPACLQSSPERKQSAAARLHFFGTVPVCWDEWLRCMRGSDVILHWKIKMARNQTMPSTPGAIYDLHISFRTLAVAHWIKLRLWLLADCSDMPSHMNWLKYIKEIQPYVNKYTLVRKIVKLNISKPQKIFHLWPWSICIYFPHTELHKCKTTELDCNQIMSQPRAAINSVECKSSTFN